MDRDQAFYAEGICFLFVPREAGSERSGLNALTAGSRRALEEAAEEGLLRVEGGLGQGQIGL